MGKLDDLYTHPKWDGIIDLSDVNSWQLGERPNELPDAVPGSTAPTLSCFFKSLMMNRDILQGPLALEVFRDLKERVQCNVISRFPTAAEDAEWRSTSTVPNPVGHSRRSRRIPTALVDPGHAIETPAPTPTGAKPAGVSQEVAQQIYDGAKAAAATRRVELLKAGVIDTNGNILSHKFFPKFDEVINLEIDTCAYCDKNGADRKHYRRVIWANGAIREDLFNRNIIDENRNLLTHGFNPKVDMNTRRPVDTCQFCQMPGSDPIHVPPFRELTSSNVTQEAN